MPQNVRMTLLYWHKEIFLQYLFLFWFHRNQLFRHLSSLCEGLHHLLCHLHLHTWLHLFLQLQPLLYPLNGSFQVQGYQRFLGVYHNQLLRNGNDALKSHGLIPRATIQQKCLLHPNKISNGRKNMQHSSQTGKPSIWPVIRNDVSFPWCSARIYKRFLPLLAQTAP